MLNRSGKSQHPCVTPDLREKNFHPFTSECDVGLGHIMTFIKFRYVPFMPNLLIDFLLNHEWMLNFVE